MLEKLKVRKICAKYILTKRFGVKRNILFVFSCLQCKEAER